MTAWLVAFLFTQLVEIPIYVFGGKTTFLEAFGASALTHPIVWFVFPEIVRITLQPLGVGAMDRWYVMLVLAETFAVVGEALYLRYLRRRRPLMWAFIANMTSVTLGLIVRKYTGLI